MDVLTEHGFAGILGLLFNAFFGASYIIGLDGVNNGLYPGGFLTGHFKLIYQQIAYIVAVAAWSFGVSALLAFAIDKIPGLKLRASESAELLGMDDDQLGEFAYDYVEVRRDYLAWTPAKADMHRAEHDVPATDRYGITQHSQMIEGKEPSDSSADPHGPTAFEKTEREAAGQT